MIKYMGESIEYLGEIIHKTFLSCILMKKVVRITNIEVQVNVCLIHFKFRIIFCSNPCLPPLETLLLLTESPPFHWQDPTHWIPPSPSSPHLYRCTFLFFGILAFFGLTIKSNIPNLWPHRLISKIHLLCTHIHSG